MRDSEAQPCRREPLGYVGEGLGGSPNFSARGLVGLLTRRDSAVLRLLPGSLIRIRSEIEEPKIAPDRNHPLDRHRTLKRTAGFLAIVALVATAGCTVWRVKDAAELARASEPFQAEPANAVASLLVIGDSTAVGTGASGPAASIAGLIAQSRPGLRVVNRATDGAKYADFARQLQQDTQRFDTVLVLGGGNDVIRFTSESELGQNISTVADLAKQRGKTVILMPPGNVGNAPFFFAPASWVMTQRSQTLHALIRDAAQRTGATYVNLYKPKATDPFAQRPKELHAKDGLHPSDEGYREWLSELNRQASLETALAAPR